MRLAQRGGHIVCRDINLGIIGLAAEEPQKPRVRRFVRGCDNGIAQRIFAVHRRIIGQSARCLRILGQLHIAQAANLLQWILTATGHGDNCCDDQNGWFQR